jgi:hypothetical protein
MAATVPGNFARVLHDPHFAGGAKFGSSQISFEKRGGPPGDRTRDTLIKSSLRKKAK